MTVQLFCGDCLTALPSLADGSIDLTVTSPPYDNLRKYNGYNFNFEGIAKELYRVTKPGGVVVWVVGDETKDGCESLTSFKQAIYFVEGCGFNLHDTMIYEKAGLAFPDTNRYYQVFEYMFVLSKGEIGTYNLLADRKNIWAGQKVHSTVRNRDGSLTPKVCIGNETKKTGVRYNIWRIPHNLPGRASHPASFPEALAADHIVSWSNPGDVVLDPMMGSGTTGKMAVKLGRSFVGVECSSEYFAIAQKRIAQAESQPALLQV